MRKIEVRFEVDMTVIASTRRSKVGCDANEAVEIMCRVRGKLELSPTLPGWLSARSHGVPRRHCMEAIAMIEFDPPGRGAVRNDT